MKSKFKSTTLWIAISTLCLIPLSWIVEYFLKMRLLQFMVTNNLTVGELKEVFIDIPMGPIITLATFAISIYGGRKAGREISTNLGLPAGKNNESDTQGNA